MIASAVKSFSLEDILDDCFEEVTDLLYLELHLYVHYPSRVFVLMMFIVYLCNFMGRLGFKYLFDIKNL